jgi:ketosteroid isomerase-like protein
MQRAPSLDTAESAEEAFYDAMRNGDVDQMMAVWSTEDEVACVHPGGTRLLGLAAVRASWEAILASGGVDVRATVTTAHTGAVIAVHHLVEQISVNSSAGSQTVECVVTNVYVKGATGWRMVLHHGSPGSESSPAPPIGVLLH